MENYSMKIKSYMTKSQLIQALAKKSKISKALASIVVSNIFESIMNSLRKGQRIELREFGTFQLRHYKSYQGRNPQTGEKITVKAKTLPFFKLGKFKTKLKKTNSA